MGSFAFLYVRVQVWGVFASLFLYVYVHVSACTHSCTDVFMCMWRPEVTMGFLPLLFYILLFETDSPGQRAHKSS